MLNEGRLLEAVLKTGRGVASCGGGLEPLSREARDPASRALRPGREELAVTDPDASPVREARDRSPKSPRWSAGRRASRVMGRKAPRKAPGLPRQVQAHGCLASTRTSLGAPPPLSPGERSKRKKPRAQKTRRGNGKVLFDESSFSSSFRPSRDSGEGRNP